MALLRTVRSVDTASVPAWIVSIAWGASLCAPGCGDGLVDEQYRGASLWQFSGGTERSGTLVDGIDQVRMALFWNPKGEVGTDPTQYVELTSSGLDLQVASPYQLNIYQYPGAEHIARTPDGRSRGFAVGRILAYVDVDHNGKYSTGDLFVGILPNRAFLYVPGDLPAWATPTSDALPAGLYPVALPQRCDVQVATGTDPANCGVKLGISCKTDSGCGSNGVCLRETDVPWPTGYCTIADSASTTCRPLQSSYYGVPKYGLTLSGINGYYLQSCTSDEDCAKTGVRGSGLYLCDKGLLACVPNPGGKLLVGNSPMVEPFCIGGS